MNFVLPTRSEVGFLDPEIAGEGEKIIHSDGEVVSWNPPPVKPVVPDFSGIKSLQKYFNRTGFSPWPAWLYHPAEPKRLVKNAIEGAELGVCYREATHDERSRYGKTAVWDWKEDSKWRPEPWAGRERFDPDNPGHGKTVIMGQANPVHAQNELVRALIPEVAAAVAKAMQGSASMSAPATVDPAEWEAFQQFLAFKKSSEVLGAHEAKARESNAMSAGLSPEQERELWLQEAEDKGVKVDGRWSLERIKSEVEKAA